MVDVGKSFERMVEQAIHVRGERVGHHGINVLDSTAKLAIGATKFVDCFVAGTFAHVAVLDVAKEAIQFKNVSEVRPQHSL